MKRLRRILLEYEDGTIREVPYESLDEQMQHEFSCLGLGDWLSAADQHSYILLNWADG
jgi:hypothetical protein